MKLEHTPRSIRFQPCLDNACEDTPVSHRHRLNQPLRIILADDHPVVLMGVETALRASGESAFSIVALATNADELIAHLECTPCDLVISDYSMPYGRFPDGLALMGYLRRHFAHVPLIVMTMLRNPSLLQALLNAGVSGLFDKRSPLSELKRAVNSVTRGRRHLCPTFAGILDAQSLYSCGDDGPSVSLSERELEVVRLFVQGLSGRQIAAQLNRSEKTISRQKRTAMDKLGLGHDGGLVEFARVSGLNS
ncbi:response regulator transcription factor [Pseudomonas sp. PCH199]|uniref:response regulator transcription factor n=1 Tax=unclassified Pseudomonas TaxID=196821 RepID=UPI000BDC05FF|nr:MULTISPECIES: response regulator transcription factor [unclassified Pseudomonas]MCW8275019.1 response regulator transcription factor [Pseudomonas sp. PCH199]PAM84695.1 DNA-binding response regulator [Pseudomonas sp. ERMR1:02]